MHYILLDTIEAYNQLNLSVSSSRGYPYANTTMYAPEVAEEFIDYVKQDIPEMGVYSFDESGEPYVAPPDYLPVVKYKFPIEDDIMVVVMALKGKSLYDANMSRVFEKM